MAQAGAAYGCATRSRPMYGASGASRASGIIFSIRLGESRDVACAGNLEARSLKESAVAPALSPLQAVERRLASAPCSALHAGRRLSELSRGIQAVAYSSDRSPAYR